MRLRLGVIRRLALQSWQAIGRWVPPRGQFRADWKAFCLPEFSMHLMVTWRYVSPDVAARNKAAGELAASLTPYSWVRPLEDTYVIKVADQAAYNTLLAKFASIATSNPNVVHI